MFIGIVLFVFGGLALAIAGSTYEKKDTVGFFIVGVIIWIITAISGTLCILESGNGNPGEPRRLNASMIYRLQGQVTTTTGKTIAIVENAKGTATCVWSLQPFSEKTKFVKLVLKDREYVLRPADAEPETVAEEETKTVPKPEKPVTPKKPKNRQ